MILGYFPVKGVREVRKDIHVLTFWSPQIAGVIQPGQFVNLKVSETTDPLLRRPFSVYRTVGDEVQIIFQVIGKGTRALQQAQKGETLDVLGPLGGRFSYDDQSFDTAVLIGGGLGVAPLPILTEFLKRAGKRVVSFLGARTTDKIVDDHLEGTSVATDDGSRGIRGTVVDLARKMLTPASCDKPMMFACGPNSMLRAAAALALELGIPCEVSLEGPMGCGFGICQGCPVELVGAERKYGLMCKDGTVFNARTIVI